MARMESQAVAGYFATPPHLMPRIAGLVAGPRIPAQVPTYFYPPERLCACDPCAGDGAALIALAEGITGERAGAQRMAVLYGCELEATRAEALAKALRGDGYGRGGSLHGDAFRLEVQPKSFDVVYLNPPYDHDPEHRRLEERFLARFAPTVALGGALVFVVPFYALEASAATLGRHFGEVFCYRFPAEDFAAFSQVVLVAKRRYSLDAPDPRIVATVEAWARDASVIPELPEAPEAVVDVRGVRRADPTWALRPVDVQGLLARFEPWRAQLRAGSLATIPGVLPAPEGDLLARVYPLAVAPRPSHIAAGIAAGVFNGARVEPDSAAAGLPALLVKGAFTRARVKVDQRTNGDGAVTGEVHMEVPRLAVTVLDLERYRYHTLSADAEPTGGREVDGMSTGDLLQHYGRGLLSTLRAQCPVHYDPARDADAVALAPVARPLYSAQAEVVRAAVTLFRRGDRGVFLLGEIGVGKSACALATAATMGARRALVLCPPHLLDSWRDQVAAVLPSARAVVLSSLGDLEAFAADAPASETPLVAILSRETAKLSHAWRGVEGGRCPRCNASTPAGDLAKRRTRCEHTPRVPANAAAGLAGALAAQLVGSMPDHPFVRACAPSLFLGRVAAARRSSDPARLARIVGHAGLAALAVDVARMAAVAVENYDAREAATRAAMALSLALASDDTTRAMVDAVRAVPGGAPLRLALELALTMAPGEGMLGVVSEIEVAQDPSEDAGAHTLAARASRVAKALAAGWAAPRERRWVGRHDYAVEDFSDRHVVRGATATTCGVRGDAALMLTALEALSGIARYTRGEACEEPLYQADPQPRRVALATHIARRYPKLFDFLIADEAHEFSGAGSAQERAAHRLTELGLPTLLLTGSVMNGYAQSLFANLWAVSPAFRAEFGRDDEGAFVATYGFRKLLVEERDGKGRVKEFGAQSDRVTSSERVLGNAPGVMPQLLLKHLLPLAVTIQKADLALDLAPHEERAVEIEPGDALSKSYTALSVALLAAVRRDAFGPRAGKLWGQVAELPSYLDRASREAGNVDAALLARIASGLDGGAAPPCELGDFACMYPDDTEDSTPVALASAFETDVVLPKERWMLDTMRAELAEGRRVMILGWHERVLPRLARLIEAELGERAALLDAKKVAAAKRQGWIDREVIANGRRVLVVNPVAVQTGLNNLVWFSTQLWMQNPAVNPVVYRQAVGRIDRIGKRLPTRVYFPVYLGTAQAFAHRLLMQKVAVSMATDGLDAEAALGAAGAGEVDTLGGMGVGRQLYELLMGAG